MFLQWLVLLMRLSVLLWLFSCNHFLHGAPKKQRLFLTTYRRSHRRHSYQCNLGCFFGIRGYWNQKSSKNIIPIERRNLRHLTLGAEPLFTRLPTRLVFSETRRTLRQVAAYNEDHANRLWLLPTSSLVPRGCALAGSSRQ